MGNSRFHEIFKRFESGLKRDGGLKPFLFDEVVPTGFEELDRHLDGFVAGEIILITGDKAVGKTAFLVGLMRNWILLKTPMAFFSMKYYSELIMLRLVSQMGGVVSEVIRRGQLLEKELNQLFLAVQPLENASVSLFDDVLTLDTLEEQIHYLVLEKGIKEVLIDDFSLIRVSNAEVISETERLGIIAKRLKVIAQNYGIVVVMNTVCKSLSINRRKAGVGGWNTCDIVKKEFDLDAFDAVVAIDRPEYYGLENGTTNNSVLGVASLFFLKIRSKDEFSVKLKFDSKTSNFLEK